MRELCWIYLERASVDDVRTEYPKVTGWAKSAEQSYCDLAESTNLTHLDQHPHSSHNVSDRRKKLQHEIGTRLGCYCIGIHRRQPTDDRQPTNQLAKVASDLPSHAMDLLPCPSKLLHP